MQMKHFEFNIQAKGGSGKSMLTYLQALKNETNPRSYFIDLDSSVKSSTQQLKFLQGKTPARFALMNLLDSRDKLDRQLLFENLLELTQKDYDHFFLDFGAPESDQLPSLFSKDYSIEEFKQIQDELNATFIFNIIVAGGGAYESSTKYLQKVTDLINGIFEVNIYINQSTFLNHPHLIEELKIFASIKKNKINALKLFGDFDSTTAPHKNILRSIEKGKGMDAYVFVEKIKIQKELAKI
jgi:cellulose biosynthesis protein BcsQ